MALSLLPTPAELASLTSLDDNGQVFKHRCGSISPWHLALFGQWECWLWALQMWFRLLSAPCGSHWWTPTVREQEIVSFHRWRWSNRRWCGGLHVACSRWRTSTCSGLLHLHDQWLWVVWRRHLEIRRRSRLVIMLINLMTQKLKQSMQQSWRRHMQLTGWRQVLIQDQRLIRRKNSWQSCMPRSPREMTARISAFSLLLSSHAETDELRRRLATGYCTSSWRVIQGSKDPRTSRDGGSTGSSFWCWAGLILPQVFASPSSRLLLWKNTLIVFKSWSQSFRSAGILSCKLKMGWGLNSLKGSIDSWQGQGCRWTNHGLGFSSVLLHETIITGQGLWFFRHRRSLLEVDRAKGCRRVWLRSTHFRCSSFGAFKGWSCSRRTHFETCKEEEKREASQGGGHEELKRWWSFQAMECLTWCYFGKGEHARKYGTLFGRVLIQWGQKWACGHLVGWPDHPLWAADEVWEEALLHLEVVCFQVRPEEGGSTLECRCKSNLCGSCLEAPSRSGSWLGSWCCGADPVTVTGHLWGGQGSNTSLVLVLTSLRFSGWHDIAVKSRGLMWEMPFQKHLGRVQNAEIKLEKLHHSVLDVRHLDRVQFREEVRQSIIPFAVVISQSLRRCAWDAFLGLKRKTRYPTGSFLKAQTL